MLVEEAPPSPPQPARVAAGAADDNRQFNAFLKFLRDHPHQSLPHDVADRRIITVLDRTGSPIPEARIVVAHPGGPALVERRTYADGRTLVFPSELPAADRTNLELSVTAGGVTTRRPLLASAHAVEVKLDVTRTAPGTVPLDVAFILDTTGSMGDEIEQLKATLEAIHFQITSLSPRPDVRFGMVLYRDRGDDYVTQVVPFISNLVAFRTELAQVEAGGGGDDPEDVQAGLEQAVRGLDWRGAGVRLAFLIGDAAPHLDYDEPYTYVRAMQDAARKGIKITAIGASGLPIEGELVWRQLAQYTMAPFVFLTRGEKGNAEGSPSSVSHHVGTNWVADTLDAIVVRMAKLEVGSWSGRGPGRFEDYFQASRTQVDPQAVLEDLFQQSIKQLSDYAVEPIDERTPTVMLPTASRSGQLKPMAGKLERRLQLALTRARSFQLLEQRERQELLSTLAEQFALAYDSGKMIEVGKLVPARLAVLSELNPGSSGNLEMLVKLVRLETGEVLSLSLLKIQPSLLD